MPHFVGVAYLQNNFKNSLKNASILYLFFEILLGSEQLHFIVGKIMILIADESGILSGFSFMNESKKKYVIILIILDKLRFIIKNKIKME